MPQGSYTCPDSIGYDVLKALFTFVPETLKDFDHTWGMHIGKSIAEIWKEASDRCGVYSCELKSWRVVLEQQQQEAFNQTIQSILGGSSAVDILYTKKDFQCGPEISEVGVPRILFRDLGTWLQIAYKNAATLTDLSLGYHYKTGTYNDIVISELRLEGTRFCSRQYPVYTPQYCAAAPPINSATLRTTAHVATTRVFSDLFNATTLADSFTTIASTVTANVTEFLNESLGDATTHDPTFKDASAHDENKERNYTVQMIVMGLGVFGIACATTILCRRAWRYYCKNRENNKERGGKVEDTMAAEDGGNDLELKSCDNCSIYTDKYNMPYPAEYGYLPGAAYHTYDEIGESTSYAMPSALAEVHATHSLLTSSASVLSILDECNAEDVSEGLPPEQEMAL